MKIFVGGLWSRVKPRELNELVAQRLRAPWYRLHAPRGRLTTCELLELTDLESHAKEYCAVLEIQPSRLGWEVLQYLDGLQANGTRLRAHKWFPREGTVDRRIDDSRQEAGVARERRARADRRRHVDIVSLRANLLQPVPSFQRSYGV